MSDARLEQARQHYEAGRFEQARAILQRVLQSSPTHAGAANGMAMVLARLGQFEQAVFFVRRAVAAHPLDASLLLTLGNTLGMMGKAEESAQTLRRALEIDPARDDARIGLATALRQLDRFPEAEAILRDLAARHPGDAAVASLLSATLWSMARVEESVDLARAALALSPGNAELASMLANALNYDPRATPEETFEAHRRFGALLPAAAAPTVWKGTKDPDRPLRVGLISHDLRRHSCAFFLEPLLRNLDPNDLALTCYSTSDKEDDITARLRSIAPAWRPAASLADAALADRILADSIDVLIETGGLTQGHRLGVMARRPAPVQVTFLGYPNTTGLGAIGARLVDSHTDPPGADAFAVERLVRLDPCFLCYAPPGDAPQVSPGPAEGAPIAFGSFNAATKINAPLIELWARVLDAVPGSVLVLKAFNFRDPAMRDAMLARFTSGGIGPERLRLLPPAGSIPEHLGFYGRLHVALDTFPYHGTTTTLEALLMGVPVVTLAGRSHASRVGVSLLTNMGLGDLVARDAVEFVRLASGLARDGERLRQLRGSLRPTLMASPICDGAAYAARFARAIRDLWRRWCAG
ncbi:MAG: tetratricopeptide repeat protein [Phycisphaerae bacterium]|nr:tetratricopeptide repeat protein [Phycisphaerae bacterium]